jgi:hypothetical protein
VARHNRTGRGVDQCGTEYTIAYQPDWLRRMKVTRKLKSGRQSTMNVFRNPSDHREAEPGTRVRTCLESTDEPVDFEIALKDPNARVKKVVVHYELPPPERSGKGRRGGRRTKPKEIVFTFENGLKPPLDPR